MDLDRVVPVLERMITGIYLLTTCAGEERHVMVVSWVTQTSWHPLRVAVAIRKNRHAHGVIPRGGNFALHLLEKGTRPHLQGIRDALAGPARDNPRFEFGISGAPILSGCLGYLDCTLQAAVDAGDHTLFIGQVVGGGLFSTASSVSSVDYGKPYLGER